MLHKTRGIIFKTTDYSESSVIAQIFTEKFGLQSYMINGVKKPRAKIRQNMLQPLHLLDMIVYHKPAANIQRVSDLRATPVFQSIPYDMVKRSLVLFLNEVLYKSIRQQSADEILFEYVYHSIELLDRMSHGTANFHLYFLLRLTRFLGFYPDKTNASSSEFFDLKSGTYSNSSPGHFFIIQNPYTAYWTELLSNNLDKPAQISLTPNERKFLVEKLLDYYRLHVENFGEIRSHRILEDVLG
jgi:DNA repair protein RecO (recombination protein O)